MLAILGIMLFGAFGLNAQTPDYDYGLGTGDNSFPLSTNSNNKVQWLYVASEFNTTVPEEGLITKVYIKRADGSSNNSIFQNLTIKIGQVPATMTQFANATFLTTEMTEVFSVASHTIPGASADSWMEFELDSPYYYDGQSNLVVEMSQTSYTNGIGVRNIQYGTTDRRILGPVANATGLLATGPADLGLDITPLGPLDIGIEDLDMEEEFCLGELQDVELTIENFGERQVDTFSIGWSIDGLVQTPFGFNEALDTIGGANDHTIDITLEDLDFPAGILEVKFWTFLPNNNDDEDPINDTITVAIEVFDFGVPSFDSWGATELNELEFQFSVVNPVNVTEYYWDFGDGNNSSLEDPIHIYAEAGTYIVTLELENNCEEATFDQELVVTEEGVNIHELANGNKYLNVYPNPTKNMLNITLTESNENHIYAWKVMDVKGSVIIENNTNNDLNELQIDVSNLSTGNYFLQVKTVKGNETVRFSKQ